MSQTLRTGFNSSDSVKDRWSGSFGMVVAIDHNEQKVAFLDREANAEINRLTLSIQFFSSPLWFFRFTPGLYVEFPGASSATRRGRILQIPDSSIVQVIEEVSGQHININVDDITVSGVQAATLPKTEQRRIWEGKRVIITRGSLKGYRGLVKAEGPTGVHVELDAKVALYGQARQHFQFGEFRLEPIAMPVASPSRLNRTSPPEDVARAVTPDPEEPEESTVYPQSSPQGMEWKYYEDTHLILHDSDECKTCDTWSMHYFIHTTHGNDTLQEAQRAHDSLRRELEEWRQELAALRREFQEVRQELKDAIASPRNDAQKPR
ncbi:hypothetical protein EDB83DRAFT_2512287 [Lactarius deliciosus]|nr:hypothetical protein EDB83DRAFT_2512287 [Lactarius deliciosus]